MVGHAYRADLAPDPCATLSFRAATRDGPWRLLSLDATAE
jgi:hypothetical protein